MEKYKYTIDNIGYGEKTIKRRAGRYQYKRLPLTDSEQAELIAACDEKNPEELYTILVLLDTGLGPTDLLRLNRDAIDYQGGLIRFARKKTGINVIIPISKRLTGILPVYLQSRRQISDQTVRNLVKRVAKRAKITKKVTPYVLRHTFAVNALKRGVDLRSLQKVLGHTDIGMTSAYLNLYDEDVIKKFKEAGW